MLITELPETGGGDSGARGGPAGFAAEAPPDGEADVGGGSGFGEKGVGGVAGGAFAVGGTRNRADRWPAGLPGGSGGAADLPEAATRKVPWQKGHSSAPPAASSGAANSRWQVGQRTRTGMVAWSWAGGV